MSVRSLGDGAMGTGRSRHARGRGRVRRRTMGMLNGQNVMFTRVPCDERSDRIMTL